MVKEVKVKKSDIGKKIKYRDIENINCEILADDGYYTDTRSEITYSKPKEGVITDVTFFSCVLDHYTRHSKKFYHANFIEGEKMTIHEKDTH